MIGTLLGNRYDIIEKIGEGGMANVYKAKDNKLERFVAVKILKKEYSSDIEFLKKFKAEATAAASMSDNNIVNIYDVGSKDDINYIVMEYVKGKTLKQIITDKKVIEYHEAIELAIQIAKGLECAHKNNIIHRDIKPHNILVTEEGIAKVADFGIAKASNSATITNTRKIMGSAHYFSPEQAKGGVVDCRTDIYSLGIVLYEMVTGKVPYDAESPVLIAIKHIQEAITPPKELNNDIPEILNQLILKAVEKNPAKRYQSAKEIFADLNKIKDGTYSVKDIDKGNDFTRIMDPITMDQTSIYDNVDDFEGQNEDDEKDKELGNRSDKNKLNKKKKRKLLIWSAVVIAAAVVCLALGFFVTKQIGSNNIKEVDVPDIINMKEAEAQKSIEDLKLKFKVAGKESSDKPEGTVISCSPNVGTKVKEGSTVNVYLSKGKKEIEVPSVVGKEESIAKSMLESEGFKVEVKFEHSNEEKKGIVLSQNPRENSKLVEGDTVTLIISSGSDKIEIERVIGKTLEQAKMILGSNVTINVNNTTSSNLSDKSKDGTVIEQDKIGNYSKGTVVNLTVLKYKEPERSTQEDENSNKDQNNNQNNNQTLQEIPSVVGKTQGDATNLLKSAGFNVSTVDKDTTNPEEDGKVVSISPTGTAKQGSVITISIGKLKNK